MERGETMKKKITASIIAIMTIFTLSISVTAATPSSQICVKPWGPCIQP